MSEIEFISATVSAVAAGGVSLFLPGQSEATQKQYMRLSSASVAAGDTVLCVRAFGTIIVLGKIV